jgi:5-epi-alpha-selinene synthase
MKNLVFPDLYCPFPSQINQHVDVLEKHALEWVLRFNLLKDELSYQRFRQAKFYWLAASIYPNCSIEELKIANDMISFVFIWDDQTDYDNSVLGNQPEIIKAVCNRFIEILNGAEITGEDVPLSFALSDIRQRIIQRGSLTFFHHFVHSFEDYLNGCIEEANDRLKVQLLSLEDYIRRRSSISGVALFLNLIEFCDQVTLPYFLRNHEIIKRINQMSINIPAWCNDIFSVRKEISTGQLHNLVLVLQHQQHMTLEDAIKYAVKMHNEEVNNLANLEKYIPYVGIEVDEKISKYISGIHSWIRGHMDWYLHSGRYQVEESIKLFAT